MNLVLLYKMLHLLITACVYLIRFICIHEQLGLLLTLCLFCFLILNLLTYDLCRKTKQSITVDVIVIQATINLSINFRQVYYSSMEHTRL